MNETKTMYHAVPVVSELNRVKGFDPTRFLRKTKEGPKLDLSVKKLWFRLKYPNGRIKLSALKITDQLAIIEARVYFDKNDTNHVSSFTAQTYKDTTPGGLYVEMAQHNAVDEALSSAGFGIQFAPANESRRPLASEDEVPKTVAKPVEETPTAKVEAPPEVYIYLEELDAAVESEHTFACDDNGEQIRFMVNHAKKYSIITMEEALERLSLVH